MGYYKKRKKLALVCFCGGLDGEFCDKVAVEGLCDKVAVKTSRFK
jgi:hypothetical protein